MNNYTVTIYVYGIFFLGNHGTMINKTERADLVKISGEI